MKCFFVSVRDDDNLQRQSQSFYYIEKFGRNIPLEKFNCNGGRSEKVFEFCNLKLTTKEQKNSLTTIIVPNE